VAEIATAGSTNDQTVLNSAGTGAIVLNGSTNSGTGGVVIGSGGASETTVATINNAGNAQFNGTLQVGGVSTFAGSTVVKNQADAEIDQFLWAGLTTSQKESLIYKDWNGNSQWYMVKDQNNNWALNSAVGGLDSFKAYQSTNSGDTYINASNPSGVVRINYETGSGTGFDIYGGGSSALYASFTGANAIKFPGLAASSGLDCIQVDDSGYLSNTGSACGSGGSGSAGVSSLNSLAGAVNVVAGAGISVTPSGSSITVGNSLPGAAYNVLSYGAKADAQPSIKNQGAGFSFTAGSNVVTYNGGTGGFSYTFTSADIGKYISFWPGATPPFTTGSPYVAQITGVPAGNQITLSVAAAHVQTTTAFGQWGTDLAGPLNACEAAALSATGGGVCTIPAGNYLLATTPYYVLTGASDDGSYGTPAGGSGAALSCSISGGSLTGCSVTSGGSGYTPSSTLQTSIYGGCGPIEGYDYGQCGWAWVTATTNSSGVVTSATVVYPGYGFTSAPTVTVVALGGDGATATATETGGTMNTPTLTAGGGGYTATSTLQWEALGGGCATYQTWGGTPIVATGTVATNSSGAASGVMTVTHNATGCTSNPTIIFGSYACNTGTLGSPIWAQCSNVSPLAPTKLPVHVLLVSGVSIQGASGGLSQGGATFLESTWDYATVNNNQPIMFAGTIQSEDIGNLSLNNAFMGILGTNNANFSKIHDISFATGFGMWTDATDLNFQVSNLAFYGNVPWISGGTWCQRTDYPAICGGFFDAAMIQNIVSEVAAYGGAGSLSQKFDDWFANYFWHPEFSGASTDFPETCKFPQTVSQRQTGHTVNYSGNSNVMCYRGVSSVGMAILSRAGMSTGGATFTNLTMKGGSRNILYGAIGGLQMSGFSTEGVVPLTGSNDPYRSATTLEGAIVYTGGTSDGGTDATLNGLSWFSNPSITQCLWDIGNGGYPQNMAWSSVNIKNGCGGTAPEQSLDVQNSILNPYGELLSYNPSTSASAGITFGNWGPSGNPLPVQAPVIAGEIVGDGVNTHSYSAWDYNITNKIWTINPDAFYVEAPFYLPGIAPSSGNGCLQINSAGLVTNAGSACGSGAGTVSTFAAPSGSWPSWLAPTVTNATSNPSLAVAAQSTGTGNVVLASGPTFTGNTTTFANSAAAEQDVTIQPGTGADQIGAFGWSNYAGTTEWKLKKDASNYLRLTDVVNSLDREILYQNGQTLINSGAGANAVVINSSTNSGTGGFSVESGGSSPAAVLLVTASGNATATGFVSGKFMIGSGTMSLGTGAAAGTSPAIACASGHVCDGVSGTVTLTTGTSTTTGTLATLGFPNTHTNSANCVVDVLQSGVGRVTTSTWTESTTAVTLTANTALTASTAYTVKYWCGGN
jgi:hypothetical protein